MKANKNKTMKSLSKQEQFNKEDRESTFLMYAVLFGVSALLTLAFICA